MSPEASSLAGLDYPYPTSPAQGSVTTIAPGLRWLVMPLPMSLNHINLWLVEDGNGWAIVDTGIFYEQSKTVWQRVVAEEIDGKKITRLIVTHAHPDHIGLAGWLTETLGIDLWITKGEWEIGHRISHDSGELVRESALALFRVAGLAAEIDKWVSSRNATRIPITPVPDAYHLLEDGMELKIGDHNWRIVEGRGHAPEHACLYQPELGMFIGGDQVLPKITPNVSLWPNRSDQDPLGSFLASLGKIGQEVPATVLTLPSHNLPYYGLHARLAQVRSHHADRIDEVVAACEAPQTAVQIVPVLFQRKLDQRQMAFALGEALSHLQHAVTLGRLARRERDDGAWLYQRS